MRRPLESRANLAFFPFKLFPLIMTPNTTPWIRICHLSDIPRLGARRVDRPQGPQIAVFRTQDDQIFAVLDACPHKGGPLSQGIVFGHAVACPLHNWTIELKDGCARAPDVGCVKKFQVNVEDDTIYLNADQFNEFVELKP